MKKSFENNNYLEKEVDLNIRVPKSFDEDMERRIDEALANALFDLGCELVNSGEYEDVSIPHIQNVDMSRLSFRGYDDTEFPLQFFFGYDVPKEQIQALASFWGYKGSLCQDIDIVLDLFYPEACPVEAVLTFSDNEQRWVDLRSTGNLLDQFISIIEAAGTACSAEALKRYQEIVGEQPSNLPKEPLSSQIQSAATHAEKQLNAAEKDESRRPPQR